VCRSCDACIFHGRARAGVHYDDSWPPVLGIKKKDTTRSIASSIHPSIRGWRRRSRDSRPLDAWGGVIGGL
jgi:hypothetical protein